MFSVSVNNKLLNLKQGDITQEDVDAIVNAANTSLLGGGGVDGAIHRAAGPGLLAECRTLRGCQTGDAKITGGYQLKARYVIHTVGPIYRQVIFKNQEAPQLLASAYRRSLEVAIEHQLKSISFPAISTGVYGYPKREAAEIALGVILDVLRGDNSLEVVNFVLFDSTAYAIVLQVLQEKIAQAVDILPQ